MLLLKLNILYKFFELQIGCLEQSFPFRLSGYKYYSFSGSTVIFMNNLFVLYLLL